MAILWIAGLLFFVGNSVIKESSETTNTLDYSNVVTVTAGPDCEPGTPPECCPPPPPGYPNDCNP